MSLVTKKICIAISPWSGKQCKAKAVGPNTLKKGTREFLDDRFCQMHQPGVESKKKCVCPHCHYHRQRDKHPMIQLDGKGNILNRVIVDEELSLEYGKSNGKIDKRKHSNKVKG